MPGELQFLRRLQSRFPASPPVVTGIGDDGAVIDCAHERRLVVVTDMLLDGAHFDVSRCAGELIGRKAVAVNLSDLAAMGCRPTAAFISVAVDARRSSDQQQEFLRQIYDGMESLAQRYRFTIAGGDTNAWRAPFAINVCLTGVPYCGDPVLRSGGQPGDQLFVTGPLGGSLQSGRHLTFSPRLELAAWLTQHCRPHAMIDLSDGLSLDLARLVEQSGVGAILDAEQIPIHNDVAGHAGQGSRLAAALNDGEDFELLFAVSPEQARQLSRADAGVPSRCIRIGELRKGSGCRLRNTDGTTSEISSDGFQHRF